MQFNFWPSDTTINVVNNRIMGKISVDKLDYHAGEKLANATFDVIDQKRYKEHHRELL